MHAAANAHSAELQLQALQAALEQFRAGGAAAHGLSEMARGQTILLAALPEKFTVVLHQLLDRLESSALFSEESCSFSQRDLIDSLQLWLDKAKERLSTS
ncbi:hypothetical protein [Rhodoferax sp.]|uniref:hypothetical protein n=1 Tax=Rhodoferax sp. TaxID=50421 RepID=UPI0025D01479|nr:hypothetical protein [Rhodoferax sp.]